MANHGGAGSKFMSVNLNKSYGPSSHYQNSSSSYGQAAAGRVRTAPHGGGGGGGMVVLSRPKSSQKTAPKLSVPPPLNLPSMRKEHERFDLSGPGSSSNGGSGTVPRPTSSGMGWTKTGASVGLQDKDGKLSGEAHVYEQGVQVVADVTRGASSYLPFSARSNGTGIQGSISTSSTTKNTVLRGEDFPSLQAALPTSSSSGPVHRAKDGLQKTHKHVTVDDSLPEPTDGSLVKPLADMRPHGRSSNYSHVNDSNDNNNSIYGLGSSHSREQLRKHEEYLPGSFPLIRLNPRSDWADDERDTGNKLSERSQNYVSLKCDAQWNGEFDIPKQNAFPAKTVQYERWSHRNDMKAKIPHSETPKSYPHHLDVVTPNREGNMQRTPPVVKHVPYQEEVASDRNGIGERSIGNKYGPPHFGDNLRTDRFMINRESFPGRKDFRFAQEGRHQWNQDRYRNEQSNRNHANAIQNNPMLKSSYSTNKWAHVNDTMLNYSLEKPPVSKVDRSYPEDSFLTDHGVTNFDEIDPLTGTILGVIKRKKDAKQTDFHDPVRESFEAELERVQQMQEKERQRIYQEQERAIEQARREEEERQRMIREEEERHKRLEEEARVAAQREEQERLDAIRIAEEQRIARDEEKQRILMEEERSKERARQKLLELEARIAQRQSEAAKSDLTPARTEEKDKDIYRTQDADNWEDSERMVERITTSAHSESSSDNRLYESDLRPQPPFRDDYSVFPDRTKPSNLWRRDILEDGNNSSFIQNEEDNSHRHHTQNASSIARAFPRKELHGRNSHAGVTNHVKDQRWSTTVSGDIYNKINNDFDGHFAERYAGGWGEGHFRGTPHSSFVEHQSSETDELYSYSRSRYPVKQPRVLLPPPSLESIRKTSIVVENERPSSSSFGNDERHYNHHASSGKPSLQRGYYNAEQENSEREIAEASSNVETRNIVQEQRSEECSAIRCDSQSSLSLSSPPDSPVHLSHDDMDECGDSPVITEGKEITLSANEMFEKVNPDTSLHSTSAASVHEDWTPEDERDFLGQEGQEEYDEDEDGYNEEEIHEGNEEQMGLTHEFEDLHLELEDGGDSLVLGFNDGVEVSIPNDDEFDKKSKNEGSAFGISVVQVQEQDRVDRPEDVEENLEPMSRVSVMDAEDSSRMIEETETSKQDSVTQPVGEFYRLPSSSDMMTAAAVPSSNQTELPPSNLHFGLFSGPSLIPPPFPAIQIGSIQMPLHLHSTAGPTLSHLHSAQPAFLQFGQFSYASPISQGILPISHKSVSVVQSNNGYSSAGLLSVQPDQEKSSYNITNNAQLQKGQTLSPQPNINKVNEFTSLVDGERNLVSDFLKETVTEKESGGSKALGSLSGAKGNRSDYSERNADSRSSRYFSTGFQRRPRHTTQQAEFKVLGSVDKKQSTSGQVSSNHYFRPKDDKSNFTGRTTHDYVKRESKNGSNRLPMKHTVESLGSSSSNSHGADPERRSDKKMVEQRFTQSGDGNLKINAILPEEDEDAPLQSGVVRVFKQSGIEAPSDEDDFIEVRSKRQMLNVRREQREKEIKAKSRVPKASRRLRTTPQTAVSASSNQSTISAGSQISKIIHSDFGFSERKILANVEASTGVQTIVSPPLAPIGTPALSSNVLQTDKRQHNVKTVSTDGEGLGSGVIFQSKNKILDSIQTSLSSWNNSSRINEQVLSLTQTQLDDAMKPHKYETSVTSIMDHGSTESDVATKAKVFPSSSNPINSLLAGEKIQFGAVTSPSILLPTNGVVKHGNGAPGSSLPDIKVSQSVAATKNDTAAVLLNKDKHPNKPCTNLDVSEAEAAASAVAASSNEVNVGNGLLGNSSITGLTVEQSPDGLSRAEDSLSVSLPADLSVENPPISFWPGLPSPHSSSSQLLPHFSGGGPSHFPFFEMNQHMLGGPVFAFNRQDEPSGSQQSQNNGNSAPMGAWQQCHSGLESFYGCPPSGFTGPFLSNPGGGGAGVQGLPPHMVVYNHFAPVGQYGGLSFMGTTYIPSGKQQPDWKHNHPASGIINEGGDVMVNAQGIPPSSLATTTAQHLASSSPLLSMPSALPMFDASPYQPTPDMSVQSRWSHIPPPSLAVLQQNNESTRPPPPQFSQVPPPNVDQVSSRSFSMAEKTGSSQLLDSSNNSMVKPDHLSSVSKTKPVSSNENNNNSHMKNNNGFKWQQQQKKNVYNNQHHHNQYQRKNMGSEWSSSNQNHHRMVVHGRNMSVGGDKTHPSSSTKIKQVYVAKQNPTTQNPTSG